MSIHDYINKSKMYRNYVWATETEIITLTAILGITIYYIGGSLYVGLRLIFQDGDQNYNFQKIITLLSYVVQPYK